MSKAWSIEGITMERAVLILTPHYKRAIAEVAPLLKEAKKNASVFRKRRSPRKHK